MKLSASTLKILKNFSAINDGIQLTPGNHLYTVSNHKNIFAKAIVDDIFTDLFNIYDLPQFISAISLYSADELELEFDNKQVYIGGFGGKSAIKYRGCDADMIILPTEKMLNSTGIPDPEVQFNLDEKQFKLILNSSAILSSPHVVIESSNSKIFVTNYDVSDDSSHKQSLEVGICGDKNFRFIFKSENFAKILPGSYDVELSSKGMVHFINTKIELEYFLSIELGSTFN